MGRLISKHCKGCQHLLNISMFHRNSSARDGYRSRCKECERLRRELMKPPSVEARRGLRDTPHGEAVCLTCRKLIPLTAGRRLEEHFSMERDEGFHFSYRSNPCPNETEFHALEDDDSEE